MPTTATATATTTHQSHNRSTIPRYEKDPLDLMANPPAPMSSDEGPVSPVELPEDDPLKFDFAARNNDLLQTIAIIDGFETSETRDGLIKAFDVDLGPKTPTSTPTPKSKVPFELVYFNLYAYQQRKALAQSNTTPKNGPLPTPQPPQTITDPTPLTASQHQSLIHLSPTTPLLEEFHAGVEIQSVDQRTKGVSEGLEERRRRMGYIPQPQPSASFVKPADAPITGLFTVDNILRQWEIPDHLRPRVGEMEMDGKKNEKKKSVVGDQNGQSLKRQQTTTNQLTSQTHTSPTVSQSQQSTQMNQLQAEVKANNKQMRRKQQRRGGDDGNDNDDGVDRDDDCDDNYHDDEIPDDPNLDISVLRTDSITAATKFSRYQLNPKEVKDHESLAATYKLYTILFSVGLLIIFIFVALFLWMASFSVMCLIAMGGEPGQKTHDRIEFACFSNSIVTTVFLVVLGLVPVSVVMLIGIWNTLYYMMRCCGFRQPLGGARFTRGLGG